MGGEVKKGMYVCLKGFPCKVIEVTTSKTGKHGHAKANITGTDIFTGKKVQDISPTSHNMTAPFVKVFQLTVTDVNEDDYVTLMDDNGEIREDLKLPDSDGPHAKVAEEIRKGLENEDKETIAIVTAAMGKEQITSMKLE